MIKMPARHAVAEQVARAAGKCLRLACEQHFTSVQLGDITQVVSGGTPSTNDPSFWGGDIVWITPKDLGRPRSIEITSSERRITQKACDNSSATLLPIGTVLLSSRAPIGHVGIAAVPLCTNQGFKNLICSDLLYNRYLFHMLRASIDDLEAFGRGNTFKEIPARTVKEFRIPLPPLSLQLEIGRFLDHVYMRFDGRPVDLPELPPPLSEQRRIVARIEELAAKIEEARNLCRQVEVGCDAVCRAIIFDRSNRAPTATPMRELLTMRQPDVLVRREEAYSFAGVYCFGGGVFRGPRKSGMEFAYTRLTRLRTGDFVYPKLMAWEGALGVVPPECDGLLVSPEFPVFEINQDRVLPETLDVYFRTPSVWPILSGASTGTNVRRRRLNPNDFLALDIPLPPMAAQRKLREVRTRVDTLKRLNAETVAQLGALLPSILDQAFKGEL